MKLTGRQQEAGPATAPATFAAPDFDPIGQARKDGLTPTSGYRTQRHQNALIGQGLTKTKNSSHTRGDAIDFAVPNGMSKTQALAIFKRRYPGAKVISSNGNSIHATFPGWGKAPDVSGSRKRYGN
jgi:gentisate 1,2-dioxygenase